MNYPEYCCAILTSGRTNFLLQLRPGRSQHAPNKLVCFGGKREANECPEDCIRRELQEELCWVPEQLRLAVQLWTGDTLKAWFYAGQFDVELADIQTEPGFEAKLIPAEALDPKTVSAWHWAVLQAYLQNENVVKL